ncbi:MAG: response regulator transcription factor, partial [Actinomycetota bacterium]|nr:response regulator transcription factor [Actinomycetota bacterium]
GRQALRLFREWRPDLVLLDLMLPQVNGLDVLRRIRQESAVPVIVVSAKNAEADVVAALELGADDYLTKPYSVRELVARIRATVRRAAATSDEPEVLAVGEVVLDLGRHELRVEGRAEVLPRKELALLQALMERPERVVSRDQLIDRVWGFDYVGDTRTLDQHVRRLRRRLEAVPGGPRIETLRGVGYRFTLS